MWWTAGTTRGAGQLGLTHTETQQGRFSVRFMVDAGVPPHEDFTSPHNVDCPACGGLVTALLPPQWRAPPGARGTASTHPCGVCELLVERGGGWLLMAHSASTAFGGCCGARSSWPPCALLCVLLGLVSPPCVGPIALLRAFLPIWCSFGGGGGSMSLPASHCGCWVIPLSFGWRQGHPAFLHMSPNLQTDIVSVGVVLW